MATQICFDTELIAYDTLEYCHFHKRNVIESDKIYKKFRITLKDKLPQKKTLGDLLNIVDSLLRTKESKKAHETLNRLIIIHPSKRDGGIMQSFLKDENIVTG